MSEQLPSSATRHAPWRRWQMDELHQEQPEEHAAVHAPDPAEQARRRAAFQRQAELKAQRDKIMQEAREEGYRSGFEAGHAEGHAEGLEAGRQEAQQELTQQIEATLTPLLPIAERFSRALAQLDEEVAADLVDLALATGYQLAGDALKARPRQILELVKALLHTEPPLVGQQRLWLHPLDHKLVAQHLGTELEAAGWSLQPDTELTRGGCRVTSANGELDATWESRWQAVKSQVRKRHKAKPDEE